MAVAPSREASVTVLSPWGKALAGAVAAMFASSLVYPLDLAKTRLQVQNRPSISTGKTGNASDKPEDEEYYKDTMDVLTKVYKKGGLKSLYNGLGGTLAGTVSTNFAYFYWYSLFRSMYIKRYAHTGALTTAVELFLGALAGAVAQLFTIPVSVVTTRQQTCDQDFFNAGKEVLKEDGLRGLWRGLKASLILVVNPSITYGSSSRLQTAFFGGRTRLTVAENFLLGAISKSLATITTQPLIVAKVIQQSSKKFKSFVDVLVYLVKSGGFSALFRGLGPQLSKGILVQGLLLAFKDKVESYIISLLIALNRSGSGVVPLEKI